MELPVVKIAVFSVLFLKITQSLSQIQVFMERMAWEVPKYHRINKLMKIFQENRIYNIKKNVFYTK